MVSHADPLKLEAEAASWLARLHSSRKSPNTKSAFRAWLAESEAHRQAFERATEIWDMLPSVAGNHLVSGRRAQAGRMRHIATPGASRRVALAAALAAVLVLAPLWWETRPPVYETRVGEQQVVILADHSRVALNTNSELQVKYSKAERRVVLDHGEALFEVSHDLARPFLVVSGDEVVRAVGTKFVVRREGGETRVTLLEGKVQVFGPSAPRRAPLAVLTPGQRLTVTPDAGAELDRPSSIDAVTAWRRGEIVFDNSSLIDAAEELNRYSDNHLVIADPKIASLRVSGVFSTKDVPEVAKAFASLYGLRVEQDGKNYKLKSG
jgi:transmembrane sensor